MKKISYLLTLLLVGSVLFLANCKKSNETPKLNDQQKATVALSSGQWQVSTIDSKPNLVTDQIAEPLKSLRLTFSATGSGASIVPAGFSATGANDFFSTQSGATWSWSGTGINAIALTNASTGQLTNVQFLPNVDSPTSVKVTFTVANQGRVAEIGGTYSVTLTK